MDVDDAVAKAVMDIHYYPVNPIKIVTAFAGSGADVIAHLLRHGGGSQTLLCHHLLYAQESTYQYLGVIPAKLVSGECSTQLAATAFKEACSLVSLSEHEMVAGIGVTSSLCKPKSPRDPDGERVGRNHEVYISVHMKKSTKSVAFNLVQGRSREDEESLLCLAILQVIAEIRGSKYDESIRLDKFLSSEEISHFEQTECNQNHAYDFHMDRVGMVVNRTKPYLVVRGGVMLDENITEPSIIFPGSFNPIHNGHITMASIVKEQYACSLPFFYELSITNVDKPSLDYREISARIHSIVSKSNDPILLSSLPLFSQKSHYYPPGSVFVMGIDTFERMIDPKYCNGHSVMDTMSFFVENKNKFVVFPRKDESGEVKDVYTMKLTEEQIAVVETLNVNWVSPQKFCMDISSSQIRKNSL